MDSSELGITVREMLELPVFEDSELLAGACGISRIVKRVTIAEVPDNAEWLQGGELVCSTCYHLKDNPEVLVEWVRAMANAGASALALKPERFLGGLPGAVYEEANRMAVPLIKIPLPIRWPVVIEQVMGVILERHSRILSQERELQHRLLSLLAEGKHFQDIIKAISREIPYPFFVTDSRGNLLFIEYPPEYQKVIDELGIHPDKWNLFDALQAGKIQVAKVDGGFKLSEKSRIEPIRIKMRRNKPEIEGVALPVLGGGVTLGYIGVFVEDKLPVRIVRLMERSTLVLAVELLRQHTELESVIRARVDVFHHILENKYTTEEEARLKVALIGLDVKRPFRAIVFSSFEPSAQPLARLFDHPMHRMFKETVEKYGCGCIILPQNDDIFVFIYASPGMPQALPLHKIKDLAREATKKLAAQYNIKTGIVGVSTVQEGLAGVKEAHQEVIIAKSISCNIKSEWQVVCYEELGLLRLLFPLRNTHEARKFYLEYLGPLLNDNTGKGTDLIETLNCWLSCGCNRIRAAKKLFIHVNTLNYRLNKVEEILGIDLKNPEVQFELKIALLLYSFDQNKLQQRAEQPADSFAKLMNVFS